MRAPVTLGKAPNGAIANLKLLGGVDKVGWFKPTIEELAKGIWAPESKSLTSFFMYSMSNIGGHTIHKSMGEG